MQLSTWDKEELDEKLANRVQVSKRAVAKVIQAFDRLMQRNEKITLALKGEFEGGNLIKISLNMYFLYLNFKFSVKYNTLFLFCLFTYINSNIFIYT